MKPVKQTIFGDGENGNKAGNCLSACLASILEIPIEEVPVFSAMGDDWFKNLFEWLKSKNCEYHGCARGTWILHYTTGIDGYFIVNGLSPRAGIDGNSSKMRHSVIFHKGKMVFDPHPSDAGLMSMDEAYMIERM